jgi:hypothetical protein
MQTVLPLSRAPVDVVEQKLLVLLLQKRLLVEVVLELLLLLLLLVLLLLLLLALQQQRVLLQGLQLLVLGQPCARAAQARQCGETNRQARRRRERRDRVGGVGQDASGSEERGQVARVDAAGGCGALLLLQLQLLLLLLLLLLLHEHRVERRKRRVVRHGCGTRRGLPGQVLRQERRQQVCGAGRRHGGRRRHGFPRSPEEGVRAGPPLRGQDAAGCRRERVACECC